MLNREINWEEVGVLGGWGRWPVLFSFAVHNAYYRKINKYMNEWKQAMPKNMKRIFHNEDYNFPNSDHFKFLNI